MNSNTTRAMIFGSTMAVATMGFTTWTIADTHSTVDATCKKVAGVITSVDAKNLTISPPGKPMVTGRLDSNRTRVVMDGTAAKVGDLQVTYSARGQLCLDDVWTQLTVDTRN